MENYQAGIELDEQDARREGYMKAIGDIRFMIQRLDKKALFSQHQILMQLDMELIQMTMEIGE